jgi:Glycosyl transferases group 1
MQFCAVATVDRLPHARVLARALEQHHPGSRLTVVCPAPAADEPFDSLLPGDLGVPAAERLVDEELWGDVEALLQPYLLRRTIEDGAEQAVFLSVAVDVLAPLEPVRTALETHPLVLMERLRGDLPTDGKRPESADLRRVGRLADSLVGVNRAAYDLLEWWCERATASSSGLSPSGQVDPGEARAGLARWLQLAPTRFEDAVVLHGPERGFSYWNGHQRPLERQGEEVFAAGRPLRLVHFDRFDPRLPWLLAPGSNRVAVSDQPALGDLCESYADRLLAAGWHDHRRGADVGRTLPNGLVFDDMLSELHAEAAAAGASSGDVFTAEGCEAFMRRLEQPAPYGVWAGVNRYLYACYRRRADLRRAYPDLDGLDGDGFAGWCHAFGVRELGIPGRFRPPVPPGLVLPEPGPEKDAPREEAGRERGRRRCTRPPLTVNVTGMMRGTLGLGEAARGYVLGLEAAGIAVSTTTIDVHALVENPRLAADDGYGLVEFSDREPGEERGFDLVCVNADELARFAETVGPELFGERPTIGVWGWETDSIPERWERAYPLVDEIWVYSQYVAGNLSRAAPVPVRVVPPPVLAPEPGDVHLDLSVPAGFRFLFMFDFLSTIQRKNPVGLIEAFRAAFAPAEGPQLVIKTINGRHRFEALEAVLWAARGRPDVHVIDRSLSPRERDALLVQCDCYVSLHRSEGLGLTLAECMALAKPVIGTDFSGTTDFLTAENGYPIPHGMTRVGAGVEIYPADGTWADPDRKAAARAMRQVIELPDEARAKGERARVDIERLYSPAAVGARAREALEELSRLWG